MIAKNKERYHQNRDGIIQKISEEKEQIKKLEMQVPKGRRPRNGKVAERSIKERDLYLDANQKRIFVDVKKALEIAESTDTSNRRYSKEVQPIIQLANLGTGSMPCLRKIRQRFQDSRWSLPGLLLSDDEQVSETEMGKEDQ